MKILIAEDNERMRKLIGEIVSDFADEVYQCADGEQAVQAYGDHSPDWVLMDIMMEPVDGMTATERIIRKYPDARVLMVTGYDDPGLRGRAARAGAIGYLLKSDLHRLKSVLTGYEMTLGL